MIEDAIYVQGLDNSSIPVVINVRKTPILAEQGANCIRQAIRADAAHLKSAYPSRHRSAKVMESSYLGRQTYFLAESHRLRLRSRAMQPEDLLLLVTRSMPYGKYKGRMIADLPGHYLNWFTRKGFPNGEMGRLLALMHEIDHNGLKPLLAPLRQRQNT